MIQALLISGRKYNSGRLTIYQDSSFPGLKESYNVAYLVPGSAGGAVRRNRLKRWLREDFRKLQEEEGINGAFLIKFRGTIADINHADISKDLKKAYYSIKANA
jgi:ribonuclease P protein component